MRQNLKASLFVKGSVKLGQESTYKVSGEQNIYNNIMLHAIRKPTCEDPDQPVNPSRLVGVSILHHLVVPVSIMEALGYDKSIQVCNLILTLSNN